MRVIFSTLVIFQWSFYALAQTGGMPLPARLPNGAPLPTLPQAYQQDVLQRILDATGGHRVNAAATLDTPDIPSARRVRINTQPAPLPAEAAFERADPDLPSATPLTQMERFFASRLGDLSPGVTLRQFGYDMFSRSAPQPTPAAALPDRYVLGPDDEVQIAFRGRARQTLSVRINRDGQLLLPDLPPIPAAGRTLADLRADLEQRSQRDLQGSEVYVSIGQIRQISVFVGGEVARPGFQTLTGLASVLDALAAAGGVRPAGTLRNIRIEGNGPARTLDLYPLIAGIPGDADLALKPGERIVVPSAGPMVAIAGDVARPGIFELPGGTARLEQVLDLAGGTLRPAGNHYLLLTTDRAGRRSFSDISARQPLRRGDIVLVQPDADVTANQVRLSGHVAMPLSRALSGAGSLRALVRDPRLILADSYPRYAAILRTNPTSRSRSVVGVDIGRILAGGPDIRLTDDDMVVLFSADDIDFLSSAAVQQALRGQLPTDDAGCPALLRVTNAATAAPLRFAHIRSAGFSEFAGGGCPAVFRDHPDLLTVLLDASLVLTGEVRKPGLYPVVNDTGLDMLIDAAGGLTDMADLSAVELSRQPAGRSAALSRGTLDIRSRNFAAVRLSPRDIVRMARSFSDRDTGTVVLSGEFVRPGTYDIRRGERLSELIARAGGLTPQAYPYGAVFTRETVRQRQQEGFQRSAREMEVGMMQVATAQTSAGGVSARNGASLADAVRAARELAASLREVRAAGRMVIEANPVILAARPEQDVLLEPGDTLTVPKRPGDVTVVGAVLNPGSLQFRTGWKAAQYIAAAGDTQRFADPDRAFVVLPDGSSVPARLGTWTGGGPAIPPGSLIVVPQDPAPYETWGFIRDLTQVLTQVSISSAALAVIARESH